MKQCCFFLVCTLGFVSATTAFSISKYEAKFEYTDKKMTKKTEMVYQLPALVGPYEGVLQTKGKLDPVLHTPCHCKCQEIEYGDLVFAVWNRYIYSAPFIIS
ncbi:hypothetical protein GCM10020331_068330 [Ectobacillus funiculus]